MSDHEAEAAGRRVDAYLATVKRLEPNIAIVDCDASLASIAVSLRRIADALEPPKPESSANINEILWQIADILSHKP